MVLNRHATAVLLVTADYGAAEGKGTPQSWRIHGQSPYRMVRHIQKKDALIKGDDDRASRQLKP
ncbi:MAG: hypothetical protein WCK64_06000 [Synechococcaceae cyanobacterium ELA445]